MNLIETLVEVKFPNDDDFLKIVETLTRMGVASRKEKKLYQSCHILHKQGKYYIVHFKEMFALDGKETDFSEDDKARRNKIANLLEEWQLLSIVDKNKTKEPEAATNQLKIISHKDKSEWTLTQKYTIGNFSKKT